MMKKGIEMTKKRYAALFLVLCAALLAGCGRNKKEEKTETAMTAQTASEASTEEVVASGHGSDPAGDTYHAEDPAGEHSVAMEDTAQRISSAMREEDADALLPYLEDVEAVEVPARKGVDGGHTSIMGRVREGEQDALYEELEAVFGTGRDGMTLPFDPDSITDKMSSMEQEQCYRTSMPLEKKGLLTMEACTAKNAGDTYLFIFIY